MSSLITINNLSKSFKHNNFKIEILKDVNLIVNNGDFISITGPSGSGKTTLLNIIGTLDSYYKGNFYFNKTNILNLKENEKNLFRKILLHYH